MTEREVAHDLAALRKLNLLSFTEHEINASEETLPDCARRAPGRRNADASESAYPSADVRLPAELPPTRGPVEIMTVEVEGLPPHTNFDFFVIQVPNPPFGLSWYQGDIETDDFGRAHQRFIGRFNLETFIVAPSQGLWFNSPNDATANACPGATTPFNGDHTAGVQVLNTSNFPDDKGPLRQLNP